MKRLILRATVLLGALLITTSAAAQARVVILEFSGARSAAVRNQAVRGLSDESDIELVPADQAGSPETLSNVSTCPLVAAMNRSLSSRGRARSGAELGSMSARRMAE